MKIICKRDLILSVLFILLYLSTYADEYVSPEVECCTEINSKLNEQIELQEKLLKELKIMRSGIKNTKDTIQCTVNLYESKKIDSNNNSPNKGCNFCDIIGALIGAIASGGAAIFTFVRGKRNDRKKEKQKIIDFGEEIYSLIKNTTVNARKQKQLLENYSKSIKENPHLFGDYKKISFTIFRRTQSIEASSVFNVFNTLNMSKTSYINYCTAIDFLNEFFKTAEREIDVHNNEVVTALSNKLSKLNREILTFMSEYLNKVQLEGNEFKDYEKFLNSLIVNYYESPDLPDEIDVKYDIEMIIRPLKEGIISYYRGKKGADKLLNLAKDAGDYYQTIIQQNMYIVQGLDGQFDLIDSEINKLEKIEIDLKNYYSNKS